METVVQRDFSRQQYLIPERVGTIPVHVAGVGAVGRQVALQLAALGVRDISLYDFDKVEPTNVTTQMYLSRDIGKAKVDATAGDIYNIDPEIEIHCHEDRVRPGHKISGALFLCVDTMAARKAIHARHGRNCEFFCDVRMLQESVDVYPAATPDQHEAYEKALFTDDQATPGRCTSESTVYCACFAAASMLGQYARWLRGDGVFPCSGLIFDFTPM